MTRQVTLALLLLCLAALPGCASVDTLRPGGVAPDGTLNTPTGVTMLYQQKPEAVFQAALAALPRLGLHVVEIDPARRYILAERGLTAMSNGENVGVYFAPHQGGTQVTVASRRKTATNVTAKDFAMPVHLELGAVLGASARRP